MMTERMKNRIVTGLLVAFFLAGFLFAILKPADAFSDSERRKLKQFPEFSVEEVASGGFMDGFESYALDQFPARELFRRLKAFFLYRVWGQKDNQKLYAVNGSISKMEYPLKKEAVERACERFSYIHEKYLKDTEVKTYFSIIPDKNYFLAEKNGYLAMDYDRLFEIAKKETEFMEYIDITGLLEIEDYYKTDTHWRQEKLIDVADKITDAMGVTLNAKYEQKTLEKPFYGVYYGQAALPLLPEELHYFTNEVLDGCVVYDYQNDKNCAVYDMEKADGKDPYEMFLSGALSLLTMENPSAKTEKELVLFRDSFGSSIAPLLAEGYKKITLVDIRYIHPDMLEKYIEFKKQDVLFLYSTLVLNQSETIK